MTAIVTKFGKFRYNHLPMAMCASGDKNQGKVDKLLGDLTGIKIYIDDTILLIKESFYKHI